MKKFVEPKLEVGTEFVLNGMSCVVEKIFDEHDTYQGHPFTQTKVQYYWKTSDPKMRTNWTVSLDELERQMYRESDAFLSYLIEECLDDIEYKVDSFKDVSGLDKTDLKYMISKIRTKLNEL